MDVPEVATEAAVNSDWVTHAFGRWTVSPSGVEREVQGYSQLGMLCFQTSLRSEQPSFDLPLRQAPIWWCLPVPVRAAPTT